MDPLYHALVRVVAGYVGAAEGDDHRNAAEIEQGEGLPASVVIKQIPEEARFGAKQRAMSEWAGLEFAGAIAGSAKFAPRFLGGDAEKRLIILEDLGEAQSLDHILRHAFAP